MLDDGAPDAAAIVRLLTRAATMETAPEGPRSAPLPSQGATTDPDGPAQPTFRTDIAAPTDYDRDWIFEEPAPNLVVPEEDEAMIAEATLSEIGLFRLETRAAATGYAVLVRHAEPQPDDALRALADSVAIESERFGVRARIRFTFDPALRPTS